MSVRPSSRFAGSCACAFAVLLVTGQAVDAAVPSYLLPITQTAEPFFGVTHYQITQSFDDMQIFSRELSVHIVEIDPSAPGLSFFGTPGNGSASNEYTRQTTSNFVDTFGLAVAINGDFYSTNTGITANVNGLGISNGTVVSEPASGNDRDNSLILRADNTGYISHQPVIPTDAFNAVSGNQLLLRNGNNVTPDDGYTAVLNPHSAAGVDVDTGNIFFLTVDGRQPDFSEGMHTDEIADLLRDFGVDDAINLDGGGSSTLVFGDNPDGSARTINSPSDNANGQTPGTESLVANHLGLYATPNPDYVPLAVPKRPPAPEADPLLTQLTIFDDFETGEGHFNGSPTFSGSTNGITGDSTAELSSDEAFLGHNSQKLTLVRNGDASSRVRHVSGGGDPVNNRTDVGGEPAAMGNEGFVGFFLKTDEQDLQVSIGIDDGTGGISADLERGDYRDVTADGEWHLYEWDLADADEWFNFANGNGLIDGPNAYVDSLFFLSGATTANGTFELYIDGIAYNPNGSLSVLVPEPTSLMLLLPGVALLRRRKG